MIAHRAVGSVGKGFVQVDEVRYCSVYEAYRCQHGRSLVSSLSLYLNEVRLVGSYISEVLLRFGLLILVLQGHIHHKPLVSKSALHRGDCLCSPKRLLAYREYGEVLLYLTQMALYSPTDLVRASLVIESALYALCFPLSSLHEIESIEACYV